MTFGLILSNCPATPANETQPTDEEMYKMIIKCVEGLTFISYVNMRSGIKKRNIVSARRVAMWLIRKHTNFSLKEIGRRFGDRDHSTVATALYQVSEVWPVNGMMNIIERAESNLSKMVG